jgi:hypothetical protein
VDLALDWLSQEEGDFLRSSPSPCPRLDENDFLTKGAQHRDVSGLGLRREVINQAHSQGSYPSSKGFISYFLEVEEQRGFSYDIRVLSSVFRPEDS